MAGRRFLLIPVLAGIALNADAAPFFTGVGSLGEPFGTVRSSATAVSADGSTVVGYTSSPLADNFEGFLWRGGAMTGLGDLSGGIYRSVASGVSADGAIIVGESTSASGQTAFLWVGGVMNGFAGLPGARGSYASDVSGDGSVVVGVSHVANDIQEAFRWEAGAMTGLSVLPGGDPRSGAQAVSADGRVVVGFSSSANGTSEAFRWEDGVIVGLGALPATVFSSNALAVSGDGAVVVGASNSGEGREAFSWEAGTMRPLGDLPGGDLDSGAEAITPDGVIAVGWGSSNAGETEAVVFLPGGVRSLHDVLVSDLGLDLTGWHLLTATGISADAQTIVGSGINPAGEMEGWVATVLPLIRSDVPIDIQPGISPNRLNLAAPLPQAVAILGSDAFDVSTIDRGSLRFGPKRAAPAFDLYDPSVYERSTLDVNHDSYPDLVVHFRVQDTGILSTDMRACLEGGVDTVPFRSCDDIAPFVQSCGLGFELALFLPLLLCARTLWRRVSDSSSDCLEVG